MADEGELVNALHEDIQLRVDDAVKDKLTRQLNVSWGLVLGKVRHSEILVVDILNLTGKGFSECLDSGSGSEPRGGQAERYVVGVMATIPRGIDIIGIFSHDKKLKEKVISFATDILIPILEDGLEDFDEALDKFLFCEISDENESFRFEFLADMEEDSEDGKGRPNLSVEFSNCVSKDMLAKAVCLHLKHTLPCQLSTVDLEGSVTAEYNRMKSKIKDGEVALISAGSNDIFIPDGSRPNHLKDFFNSKTALKMKDPIELEVLLSMTSLQNTDSEIYCPILMFSTTLDEVIKFDLQLDVVIYADPSSTTLAFIQSAKDALCIQAKHILFSMLDIQKAFGICKVGAFHFKPSEINHFVTVVYPINKLDCSVVSDEDLLKERKQLHIMFQLSDEKPIFRKSQEYFNSISSDHLINPHYGLKSGISDGISVSVIGKYAYHHYMQDRFDDNGWGCAYRSLQTICSWFKLQGYTTVDVPNHRQIQETLATVGDKPNNFVGSRQWIGSFEVAICLQEILQVQSKILHVPTGAEMAFKGRELIEHFKTQGTPIMIGGGVLAHTILGVHFNESTGDIKFLILDPHYTGCEDLKTVQEKGWCGWKGPAFWDQTAHYNMCLPQRPLML